MLQHSWTIQSGESYETWICRVTYLAKSSHFVMDPFLKAAAGLSRLKADFASVAFPLCVLNMLNNPEIINDLSLWVTNLLEDISVPTQAARLILSTIQVLHQHSVAAHQLSIQNSKNDRKKQKQKRRRISRKLYVFQN